MQCPVWSRVSVLSRCLNLLCVEVCPTVVLKGVYRGEVECESVTPTALTVTESCRSSGRREHRTSVCRLSCLAFHHRPSAQALQEVLRFWLTLNSGFFGNSPRLHFSFSSHFLHSVVNSSVHLAVLIRGEEEENLQILEDGSCFPRFFCFSFLSEQPSSFSWHPTLHVKTSSIFSIGPLTDQSWTQILYNCGLFCGIFFVFSILSLYQDLFLVQLWSRVHRPFSVHPPV